MPVSRAWILGDRAELRDPGRDELDARDREVPREGGERRGRRLRVRSPGAHEAGLLARQGPGARHPPIRSSVAVTSGASHPAPRTPAALRDPVLSPHRAGPVPRGQATSAEIESAENTREPSGSQPRTHHVVRAPVRAPIQASHFDALTPHPSVPLRREGTSRDDAVDDPNAGSKPTGRPRGRCRRRSHAPGMRQNARLSAAASVSDRLA